MSRTFLTRSGSVEHLNVSYRYGGKTEAHKNRQLAVCDIPDSDATLRALRTPLGGVLRHHFERPGNHCVDTIIIDRTRCAVASMPSSQFAAKRIHRDRLLGHRQAVRDVYAINTSSALENDQLDQPHDLRRVSLSLPSLQLLTLAVTQHDFRLRSA